MGLSIAHQLARRGCAVQVISRRRSEAAGFVAAGMLAPHAEGLSGPLLALGQQSLSCIPRWVGQIEADSGLTCGLRTMEEQQALVDSGASQTMKSKHLEGNAVDVVAYIEVIHKPIKFMISAIQWVKSFVFSIGRGAVIISALQLAA